MASLVEAGDCAGCHTADPAKPFAGGKPIDTPFGAIYSPNLTPDPTNRHRRLERSRISTARCAFGVAPDGSHYYPAFPYPYFTRLTRHDILAIRAYLATLTPVSEQGAPAGLALPASTYRVVMRAWNSLFFKPGIFEPDQNKSTGLDSRPLSGHGTGALRRLPYAEEHVRRRQARPRAFAAARSHGWFAPRLDGAERSGLKSWSVDDIVEYLQSGRNGRSHADGPMAEVVVNSTSKMSDADVRAIAIYLKELPPGPPEPAVSHPPRPRWRRDKRSTPTHASPAMRPMAPGAPRIYPPLPGNPCLQSADPHRRCASSSTARRP